MKKNSSPESFLQWKLGNFLRGQYSMLLNDRTKNDNDRIKEMKALEDMTLYIRNYEENKRKLKHYEELLKEHIEHCDDGR